MNTGVKLSEQENQYQKISYMNNNKNRVALKEL